MCCLTMVCSLADLWNLDFWKQTQTCFYCCIFPVKFSFTYVYIKYDFQLTDSKKEYFSEMYRFEKLFSCPKEYYHFNNFRSTFSCWTSSLFTYNTEYFRLKKLLCAKWTHNVRLFYSNKHFFVFNVKSNLLFYLLTVPTS